MLQAKFKQPQGWTKEEVKQEYPELTVGEKYEVRYVWMNVSFTRIFLKDHKYGFNSIFFDFEEDGEPIDIFKSPKYNPYLPFIKEVKE